MGAASTQAAYVLPLGMLCKSTSRLQTSDPSPACQCQHDEAGERTQASRPRRKLLDCAKRAVSVPGTFPSPASHYLWALGEGGEGVGRVAKGREKEKEDPDRGNSGR